MNYPQISFQVRKQSTESLAEMGERVGGALGCTFIESTSKLFEPGEALEAAVLGLSVSISHDPGLAEGEPRTYVLMGGLRDDIEEGWPLEAPRLSISEYMLGVMTATDGDGWYLATKAEKRAEAGAGPDLASADAGPGRTGPNRV